MLTSRRFVLASGAAIGLGSGRARAQSANDARFAPRGVGKEDAPVTATEFFSLTCTHCAAFSRETMPQVRKELVDTGKLRLVYWDFPLDQLALAAAMVARHLPVERYEPFCAALFASQDRWAFARNINPLDELAKMAALAGLSAEGFKAAIGDTELRAWILKRQDEAQKTYRVDSTPTFIFNGRGAKDRREPGAISFEAFSRLVGQAAG